jgi:hypothetical protein
MEGRKKHITYRLSNFWIKFKNQVDEMGINDDIFIIESSSSGKIYVRVEEMLNILNALIELEHIELKPENSRCFAFSREIENGMRLNGKYLIGTRIGEKMKIKILDFYGSCKREDYREVKIDINKDDISELTGYVFRTLSYHSKQGLPKISLNCL